MLARSKATPAKIPSNHSIKRAWPRTCATAASVLCGKPNANPGLTSASADCTRVAVEAEHPRSSNTLARCRGLARWRVSPWAEHHGLRVRKAFDYLHSKEYRR